MARQESGHGALGYYRTPTIHNDTIVFMSEGNLWRVGVQGGLAQRLTTHPSVETFPAISPDGRFLAFTASYEGPSEVYVMPLNGGLPKRCTYEGGGASVVGWTRDGKVLYSTIHYSTLPNAELCTVNPVTLVHAVLPLAQAHDGSYSDDGKTLFFTRFSFQGSHTKRYQGGTAQNIWRWDGGDNEAKPLTPDFKGTSRTPMWWQGRVYFESDRDGVMNIWSMDETGHSLKEHTHFTDYDVQGSSLDNGRIVFQQGADLRMLDIATDETKLIPITLESDLDQTRETWIKNPMSWTTSAHISPDGNRIALTARGQVFVAPVKQGRLIETTRKPLVRYRDASFMEDGKSLVSFSDESGEVELWKLDPLGTNDKAPEQLTKDGTILRLGMEVSPDGKWIAHTDKGHRLYLYDVSSKTNKKIADSDVDDIGQMAWSADSKYLAFVQPSTNMFDQIKIYTLANGKTIDATTDRYNNESPAFSPDGRFLYFVSDRNLQTKVGATWGSREPEPYFDNQNMIFFVSLQRGNRSPFKEDDELTPEKKEPEKPKTPLPELEPAGLRDRIEATPIPAGNYGNLTVCGNHLYYMTQAAEGGSFSLTATPIQNHDIKPVTILPNSNFYEPTLDHKKILAGAMENMYVFESNGAAANASESHVNLNGWTFSFDPKEEWRQMFEEAWRLHRDYLYAPNMQGVDWPAMRKKYRPLVDRVNDRSELSDVLAQMVGEVSLLHTFVYGGDSRPGTDSVPVASLGANWERDPGAGGYRLTRLYRTDPDVPSEIGPLLRPGIELKEGDVVAEIDGTPTLSADDPASLLRAKVGRQTRIKVFPAGDRGKARDYIVVPSSQGQAMDRRYSDWEYSRRQIVDQESNGKLGYLHLRAMGGGDFNTFARDFYPVFDRQGLIIDVRHNGGGNIDSWILEKLIRKAWMLWKPQKGQPYWNMQFAFRGPMVVLCNENTASDGEAFTEGFRRLGLGKVIGTRTWGGEVWLTGSNTLVDRGVATAAEIGVYGPEGKWLIEGHGVDPDIVIDNLPHETYKGRDAQLDAAIKFLQDEIAKHPNPVPAVPPYPDKSFHPKGQGGYRLPLP